MERSVIQVSGVRRGACTDRAVTPGFRCVPFGLRHLALKSAHLQFVCIPKALMRRWLFRYLTTASDNGYFP